MKNSVKLALAAVVLVGCSPVMANAQEASAHDSAAIKSESHVNTEQKNSDNNLQQSKEIQEKSSNNSSNRSLLGLFSLLFLSVL